MLNLHQFSSYIVFVAPFPLGLPCEKGESWKGCSSLEGLGFKLGVLRVRRVKRFEGFAKIGEEEFGFEG